MFSLLIFMHFDLIVPFGAGVLSSLWLLTCHCDDGS